MYNRLLFFMTALLFSLQAIAQLPRVSDPIGFNTNTHQGQAWDMLYNTDFGRSERIRNIQVPVQQGGMQIISGSNGDAYTTTHKSSNQHKSRTKYNSPSRANASFQANVDRMRQQAEERRRRERAEADRRQAQAKMQHLMMTEGAYRNWATHDHWHATVGAAMLNEIKADDFVYMPQKQETSGAELAAGIQPKTEKKSTKDVPIIYDQILKKEQPFSPSCPIQMSSNTAMMENQVKEYVDAYGDNGIVDFKNVSSPKRKYSIIVRHEEMPLDSLNMIALPEYGLAGIWGDSLIVLRDKDLNTIAWMDGNVYSYAVPCGGKLIGKAGPSLFVIEKEDSRKLIDFDTDDYSLFPNDDHSVFLLFRHSGVSTIIMVDIDKRTYSEVVRVPMNIWSIASNGIMTFALVENAVFVIDKNGNPKKIYEGDDFINDIVCSHQGLLVATDKKIFCIGSMNNTIVFHPQGASRIWYDGEYVYAQNTDKDLLLFK